MFKIVIPARYASTRLPGKPLVDICGTPMILRTWGRVVAEMPASVPVIVATDDERVAAVCGSAGADVVMTSKECRTGTDRVAEVARQDERTQFWVNVQGDEPLLPRDVIGAVLGTTTMMQRVACGMAGLSKYELLGGKHSDTLPKVVCDVNNMALYMSRSNIPWGGAGLMKQVCVYAYPRRQLLEFSRWKSGPLELAESIELLRFLEHGEPVAMVEVPGSGVAVDTHADLEHVRKLSG